MKMLHEKLKEIAKATGCSLVSSNSTILDFEQAEKISIFADIMKKTEYEQMEQDIRSFKIVGDGYTVYGSHDVSGYRYWKKESKYQGLRNPGEYNSIDISANIENVDLVDPTQLKSDLDKACAHFSHYDNRAEHDNQ